MAEGSPQTIDRIQVEISTNLQQFQDDLNQAGTSTENTKKKMSELEGSVEGTTNELKKEGTAALDAAKKTGNLGTSLSKTDDAAKKSNVLFSKASEALKKATKSTEGFAKKIETLTKPATNLLKSLGPITKILGPLGIAFGVSAGMKAVSDWFTSMQKASDAVAANIQKIENGIVLKTGTYSYADESFIRNNYEKYSSDNLSASTARLDQIFSGYGTYVSQATKETLNEEFNKLALASGEDITGLIDNTNKTLKALKVPLEKFPDYIEQLISANLKTGLSPTAALESLYNNRDTLALLEGRVNISSLIGAEGAIYRDTGSTTEIDNFFKTLSEKYAEAPEKYLDEYAKNKGAKSFEEYSKLETTTEEEVSAAVQAGKDAATAVVEAFASEVKNLASTVDLGASSLVNKLRYASMSDEEINAEIDKRLAGKTTTRTWDIISDINTAEKEYATNTMAMYDAGKITLDEQIKLLNAIRDASQTAQQQAVLQGVVSGFTSEDTGRNAFIRTLENKLRNPNDIGTQIGLTQTVTQAPLMPNADLTLTEPKEVEVQGQTIDFNNFTGTIQLPDGTILGNTNATTATMDVGSERSLVDNLLGIFGIGKASAADEIVFKDEWNGLSKSDEEESGGIDYKQTKDDLEEYTSATEEAGKVLTPFTEEVLAPMNESLQTQSDILTYNYDENVLMNDYSVNTLQPTFITETGVVHALAAAYERLAAAKKAAGAA